MAEPHETGTPGSENFSWFIGYGEVSPEDSVHLAAVHGRFGITTSFLTAAEMGEQFTPTQPTGEAPEEVLKPVQVLIRRQLDQIEDHGYHFADITLPTDIVVREHFNDFETSLRSVTTPNISKGVVTRVFHKLINGEDGAPHRKPLYESVSGSSSSRPFSSHPRWWAQVAEPTPMDGIEIIKREAIGLPPYSHNTSNVSKPQDQIMAQYGIVAGSILGVERQETGTIHSSQLTKRVLGMIVTQLRRQLSNATPDSSQAD